MEDEGGFGDHLSGVSATDGNWHHVVSAGCGEGGGAGGYQRRESERFGAQREIA